MFKIFKEQDVNLQFKKKPYEFCHVKKKNRNIRKTANLAFQSKQSIGSYKRRH